MDKFGELGVKTFYSPSTRGFYNEAIHHKEQIPRDAVELKGGDDERLSLLAGMAENKRIEPGENGYPVLKDNPPLSFDELAALVRSERDEKLRDSDWSQLADVPESTKELWSAYRQNLRDITSQKGFPRNVEWPAFPAESR